MNQIVLYLVSTLAVDRFDQINDGIDRILLGGMLHCIDVFLDGYHRDHELPLPEVLSFVSSSLPQAPY